MVNREHVHHGGKVPAYTHLVAELAVRICRQKQKEGEPFVILHLHCARVMLGPPGAQTTLRPEEYRARLGEHFAMAAIRRGLAAQSSSWRVGGLELKSGRRDRELQLCDLVSNASHADFRKCGSEAGAALRAALGAYDLSLSFLKILDRVNQLLKQEAIGLAVLTLAEWLLAPSGDAALRGEVVARLGLIREHLARMEPPSRDPHLSVLANWVELIVEVQRLPEFGARLADWMLAEIEGPLRSLIEPDAARKSLDWFAYALHLWALTARNHLGALMQARGESEALDRIAPSLAGSWEHTPLLMKGLVTQAVHLTDGFAHDRAAERMEVVARYFGDLSELYHVALPAIFPERVRSDVAARALGTWVQIEVLAGLCDPARLAKARVISDRAIDEFTATADKERQYQYRCQLKIAAGDLTRARQFLARSLRLEDDGHASIAHAIRSREGAANPVQGFALLHWLRLGIAALRSATEDAANFRTALESSGLLTSPWCAGKVPGYPTHGILRRVASIHALAGDPDAAVHTLRLLSNQIPLIIMDRIVLATIVMAGFLEVAGLLWATQPVRSRRLIDCDERGFPGLRQMLGPFREQAEGNVPALWAVVQPWQAAIDQALAGRILAPEVARIFFELTKPVDY